MRTRVVWVTAVLLTGLMGVGTSHAQEAENLLANGGFEDGAVEPWGTYGAVTSEVVQVLTGAAVPEAPIEGRYCLHLEVAEAGVNFWDSGLQHSGHVFEEGKYYTLSAFLKCNEGELNINFKPELGEDPWTGYGAQSFTMTEEWTEFSITTPVFTEDVSPGTITFHIGYTPGDFWVDGVRWYEGDYVPPAFKKILAAADPIPEDGAVDVPRDTALSWTPGPFAEAHNVYFGDNFDDGPQPTWIQYEFDRAYILREMWVWNSNQLLESLFGLGAKDVTVEYSEDGVSWTSLGDVEFAQAPGSADYNHDTTVDMAGAMAKYVRLTTNSNWGGLLPQYGLSEVRFFYIPVQAREPKPISGGKGISRDVVLDWREGREAASHEVSFSSDKDAVINGTAAVDMATESRYEPGLLDFGQTYYWKVNEVNDAASTSSWEGNLWSFSTIEYFVVDDFEGYDTGDNQIWFAWHDGLGYGTAGTEPYFAGNGTGAAVGDETTDSFTEEIIVHGGNQAMPLFYDNNQQGKFKYSESELTLSDTRDWTEGGATELSLWFHGETNNAAEPMYVALNGNAIVYNDNPDAALITEWTQWNIDLQAFADQGVNLANVNTIAIGFGDKTNPQPGGSGKMYFDDIAVGHPIKVEIDTRNILTNGGFEDGVVEPWSTYGDATAEVVQELVGAAVPDAPIEGGSCLHVVVAAAGANFWDAGLQNGGHVFEAGKQYTLSAFLKCSQGTLDINFKPELAADPWSGFGDQAFTMTEEWAEYSVTTPVIEADVDPACITFHIAYAAADFWIDDVRFYEVE